MTSSPYALISIEKAEPLPAWLPKGDWYRYVLAHNDGNLVGYHIGTLSTVTAYAETVAVDLNERDQNRKFSSVPFGNIHQHSTRQKDAISNPSPLVSPGKSSEISPCEPASSPTRTITE